jgi:hypothetical protein
VPDLVQPGFSSGHGLATEGFGQKIALDGQLTDLSVQILELSFVELIVTIGFAGKRFCHVVDGPPFPVGNHVGMETVFCSQFSQRLLALNCIKGYLGFELC